MILQVVKRIRSGRGKIVFRANRLNAFTIMELVVTMLISGLVVLAAFQVINGFSKMMVGNSKNNNDSSRQFQFHRAIARDMQTAIRLEHYDDETIFHLPEDISVSYRWDLDCVIRSVNETSDTFNIKLKDWHLVSDRKSGLPQFLEMEIENEDHETELFRLPKVYDNDQLMNITELKE